MALTIQQQQELRHVEAFDLATFLQGFEQAVKDGYSLSLEHNETYPYGTIGHYIVKMIPGAWQKEKAVEAPVAQQEGVGSQEVVQEVVEAPKKAGRPAKAK